MTVLRSRKVISPIGSKSPPESLTTVSNIAPVTPAKALEPSSNQSPGTTVGSGAWVRTPNLVGLGIGSVTGSNRRRSLRLSSKAGSGGLDSSEKGKGNGVENSVSVKDESDLVSEEKESVCGSESKGSVSSVKKPRVSNRVRSNVRVSGDLVNEVGSVGKVGDEVKSCIGEPAVILKVESDLASDFGDRSVVGKKVGSSKKGKGKRNSDVGIEFLDVKSGGEGVRDEGCLTLRSGRGIRKGTSGEIVKSEDEKECESKEVVSGSSNGRKRYSREEKGKGKSVADDVKPELGPDMNMTIDGSVSKIIHNLNNFQPKDEPKNYLNDQSDTNTKRRRRFTREEKGKHKMVDAVDLDIKMKEDVDKSTEKSSSLAAHLEGTVAVQGGSQVAHLEGTVAVQGERQVSETNGRENTARRFRDFARRNASRFAHFDVEEENNAASEGEEEQQEAAVEVNTEVEDWPGPFSTAWKIIRDRKMNKDGPCSEKSKPKNVNWLPKEGGFDCNGLVAPSLLDLCMSVLVKNADAISSLDGVPDTLRHRICHSLCDSRKMNRNYLDLLVMGYPTEIRIRDCSWLAEEEFTAAFQGCEFNNLTVLQLDQCGRSLPDYTLLATLAKSPSNLPALTTLSLKGACRLSDIGLIAIVSSAPALRSINLSQCTLLTSEGIDRLAEALGSVLRELYMDDCQGLDSIHILPALSKLEYLEVLSLSGIPSVCDDFVAQFVAVRGQNMKELNFTDCTELTDLSLKVIGECCPVLRSINLTNLCKLTDSAIGYLASCQLIQTLKLCRNSFSDEAIAAYLETCGKSLTDLSLNNVTKVSYNTAMALAKCSNLVNLDLSWCRNLTNEALGLIVDSCLSLELLKLFGCTQITDVFLNGHSNPKVKVLGLMMRPILKHIKVPELQVPLHYSSAPLST